MSPEAFIALAELVKVGISVIELVDPDDPETWMIGFNNAAAADASQFDVRTLRGTRFLESFPAVRGTPFIDWYREVHESGQEQEIPEIRYGDQNVPDAAFRVWLTPLPGRLVLGQYVNVTMQRRAEGQLRALNRELEALVDQRTEALKGSLDVLRQVSYATAHDLQTPLVQILRLGRLLGSHAEAPADADLATLVQVAEGAKQRLDALMRFTAMAVTDDPVEATSIEEVVADVLERLGDLAEGASIEVELGVRRIRAQPQRFSMLVEQLLDNALRYHEPGQPREV